MAALFTWHHNCCHFHDKNTPFSTPHHLSITTRCNKTKIQDTILTSVIGKVTHFYGDALTNYHTTIILIGVSHLVSACLFAACCWNTSNPPISHARSLAMLLSTCVVPWSLNEMAACRTDSINSWFSSVLSTLNDLWWSPFTSDLDVIPSYSKMNFLFKAFRTSWLPWNHLCYSWLGQAYFEGAVCYNSGLSVWWVAKGFSSHWTGWDRSIDNHGWWMNWPKRYEYATQAASISCIVLFSATCGGTSTASHQGKFLGRSEISRQLAGGLEEINRLNCSIWEATWIICRPD